MLTNVKLIAIFILLLISVNNICAQYYEYHGFELNKVVTFNDVVNNVEDKTKIITEPSEYQMGEDITFHDAFGTTTTLVFDDITQILHCIFIKDIATLTHMERLKQTVFQQNGVPFQGYEIKITNDVKDNTLMSDYKSFDYRYEYKYSKNYIVCGIESRSYKYNINFFVCSHKIIPNSISNFYYPSIETKEYDWVILRYQLVRKW